MAKKSKKKKQELNVKPLITFGVIIIVIVGGLFLFIKSRPEETNYYDFVDCLVEKGATMYGTESCLHCQNQKRILGRDAFKQNFAPAGLYVECNKNIPIGDAKDIISVDNDFQFTGETTQLQMCVGIDIKGTPTWIINGKRYLGEQNIEDLAEASGCPLPQDYNPDGAIIGKGYTG